MCTGYAWYFQRKDCTLRSGAFSAQASACFQSFFQKKNRNRWCRPISESMRREFAAVADLLLRTLRPEALQTNQNLFLTLQQEEVNVSNVCLGSFVSRLSPSPVPSSANSPKEHMLHRRGLHLVSRNFHVRDSQCWENGHTHLTMLPSRAKEGGK